MSSEHLFLTLKLNKNMETKQTKSAGGAVLNKQGLVLVVNQRGKSWSLPKGHIKEGEGALEAAKREISEESGIDRLELISELGAYERYRISPDGGEDLSELKTIFMFLFKTDQDTLKPTDPENPEARWVEKNTVADLLTHPKDKAFFLSVIDKIHN